MPQDPTPIRDEQRAALEQLAAEFNLCAVILFGSRARGDYRPDSDWDLAIVDSPPHGERRDELRARFGEIVSSTSVELVGVNVGGLEPGKQTVVLPFRPPRVGARLHAEQDQAALVPGGLQHEEAHAPVEGAADAGAVRPSSAGPSRSKAPERTRSRWRPGKAQDGGLRSKAEARESIRETVEDHLAVTRPNSSVFEDGNVDSMNWTCRNQWKAKVVNTPADVWTQILCSLRDLFPNSKDIQECRVKSYAN